MTNIETAIKTAIDGMTTTGGYNYNWNGVPQPDAGLASFPNVTDIMIEGEREMGTGESQVYSNEVDILIPVQGVLSSAADNPNYSINAEHNKASDDLKKLFGTNYHITNTVDRIMWQSNEREVKLNGDVFMPGVLLTRWKLYYRQDRINIEQYG
jgi:hypothetical protein